jgi:hypothetical protein
MIGGTSFSNTGPEGIRSRVWATPKKQVVGEDNVANKSSP